MGTADDPQTRSSPVIATTGAEQLYQPLQPLLADPDADVCRASAACSRACAPPRLLPLILDNLDGHATRSAAVDALAAYGDRCPWWKKRWPTARVRLSMRCAWCASVCR
ncbi:MAG: hypothetical protein R2851_28160 [Caldilineaceae bacterium]